MTLNETIKKILSWRLLLFVPAFIGLFALPFKDAFPYREAVLEPFGHPLFYAWASFDGVHYIGIAERGYWAQFTQAFFPVFPFLIRYLDLINNTLLTGLILSHASFILAVYYFYKLIRLDYSDAIAKNSLLFLLLFPTSFYFVSLYTESLFLLFVILSFYFMRTGREKYAIALAALASGTRILGIFLVPALMLEKYLQLLKDKKTKKAHLPLTYLPFAAGAFGLLAYMYYLNYNFSDPFYFLNAQPAFGAERSSDKLILLYQVIFRYLKMVVTVDWISLLFYTVMQEFISSMIFFVLGLISFKKIRPSYALFAFLAYITPTLTGTFSSMPRYVLIMFPCFILLGHIKNSYLRNTLLVISAILLFINTLLFTRGYWIA